MHCTWFNEKKKKVNFPYIFCGLFPLLTCPHICCPHRPSPAPHNTTWERSATPTPPRPPGVPRRAPWAPAQLACSF